MYMHYGMTAGMFELGSFSNRSYDRFSGFGHERTVEKFSPTRDRLIFHSKKLKRLDRTLTPHSEYINQYLSTIRLSVCLSDRHFQDGQWLIVGATCPRRNLTGCN